MYIKLLP